MHNLSAYIPRDRRLALARGADWPDRCVDARLATGDDRHQHRADFHPVRLAGDDAIRAHPQRIDAQSARVIAHWLSTISSAATRAGQLPQGLPHTNFMLQRK